MTPNRPTEDPYVGSGLNHAGWWQGQLRAKGMVYGDPFVWACKHNHKDVRKARDCAEAEQDRRAARLAVEVAKP